MLMKTKKIFMRAWAWIMILLLAAPPGTVAQQSGDNAVFKQEELDQLLAPIALYPDDLLSQIFMASTYPLEVVEASRWAKQHQNLKGDALAQALEKQDWDPSVRSLVNFPDVLSKMSEKLDWTQKLGDAFISQQKDVMDAVQRLRAKAEASGNLKTTEQQKVIVEEKIIKIEPANPQVVYVPTVVYGAWPYPAYPPYPWYPPGYVFGSMFAFGAGVALGAAWGYAWGNCNWRGGDVNVNVNRNANFNQNINRGDFSNKIGQGGQGRFQHDASHRKGVSYRDNATAQKFNRATPTQTAQAREQFRGRAEQGRQQLGQGGLGDRGGAAGLGGQGGVGNRGGGPGGGQLGGNRPSQGAPGGDRFSGQGPGNRGGAFQGIDRGGSSARDFSNRGASSRQSFSGGGGGARGGGGGGARGGGGGGGRGGGGGGGGRRR